MPPQQGNWALGEGTWWWEEGGGGGLGGIVYIFRPPRLKIIFLRGLSYQNDGVLVKPFRDQMCRLGLLWVLNM